MAPEDGGTKQMFNNLIESCTHKNELKRKGSFFFATIAVYALLLSAAGIASVVAYEAHLENQSLEIISLLTPVQPAKPEEPPERQAPRSSNNRQQVATRVNPIPRVEDSTTVPKDISTTPNKTLEIPNKNVRYEIGTTDTDPMPTGPVGDSNNSSSTNSNGKVVVPETDTTPPPVIKTETKPPRPTVVSGGVVNGSAISLPKPSYPQIAKAAGVRGQVSVQVLIDETGKVLSATVISGHPLLRQTSQQAAMQAKFKPTLLSNVPVKVSGVINYNFAF